MHMYVQHHLRSGAEMAAGDAVLVEIPGVVMLVENNVLTDWKGSQSAGCY
jgi:hypothetical protein